MKENNTSIYYVDGTFAPAHKACIPITDLAILRGYGVFDFMRTYGGQPFCFEEHIARLIQSAELIGLPLPMTQEKIAQTVLDTLARNTHSESGIRVLITGGGGNGFDQPPQPRLLVLVDPMFSYPDEYYTAGISAVTAHDARYLPEAKTINYIPAIVAYRQAQAQKKTEAIFIDRDGKILEATRSNLFIFKRDRLVTPHDGILYGVTRHTVLRLAEGRYPVEVRDMARAELLAADEAFIASSSKEIMPLVEVDGQTIGAGTPGPNTRALMRLFKEHVAAFCKR